MCVVCITFPRLSIVLGLYKSRGCKAVRLSSCVSVVCVVCLVCLHMIETNDLLGLINLNNNSNPRPPAAYLKPFSGDLSGVCSNYQGLFCCDVENVP